MAAEDSRTTVYSLFRTSFGWRESGHFIWLIKREVSEIPLKIRRLNIYMKHLSGNL